MYQFSCSIKAKNKANTRPGKIKVVIGVRIGGRKAPIINKTINKNKQLIFASLLESECQ